MVYSLLKDLEYSKEILHLSDEKLSELIGVSRATYSRWKKGTAAPNRQTLERVYSTIFSRGINLNRIYEDLYLSLEKSDSKLLFHGSKMGLTGNPSVTYSADKKDFGKGFYAGESVKQAVSFVSGVLKKALKKIDGADLIIAPIADNTMYSIINEFIEGSITDEQCINCLSANRLGKQYVFLNDAVMDTHLKPLRQVYLCEDEKRSYEIERIEETSIGKKKVILAKRQFAGAGKYIEELLG